MSFLYPGFLWALAVLAIPIIIHLFNFRRPKKVYFTNVQFLQSVQQRNKSKLQLKHLLALLARLLMLTFLVLAFAMPYLPGEGEDASSQHVFIYLDNSQSMTSPSDGGATLFDEAYHMVMALVNFMPSETRFNLLTNDFAPYSNSFKSGREVKELLSNIQPSSNTRSLDEVMSRMQAQGSDLPDGKFFLISDFQKSTSLVSANITIDTTKSINLIALEADQVPNIYVDTVYLDKPQLFANESNKLSVTLANSGRGTNEDVLVKFFINDNQVTATTATLAQNGKVTVEFDLNYTLNAINKCRISIEDYPMTFDNDYYFVLRLARKANIVEIRGSSASNAFGAVYANEQMFSFQSFDVGNVNYSEATNADLLILNELPTINQTLVTLFGSYLSKGGSLMVVPNETADSTTYEQLLAIPIRQNSQKMLTDLAQLDYRNPFFNGVFNETSARYAMPKATRLWTWPRLGDNLITFNNGDQFLSVVPRGDGRIVLLASPLKGPHTDFHRHAIFVPVMYKLVMTSMKSSANLSYLLQDGTISIALDSLGMSGVYRLAGTSGEIIPDQRVVGNNLILSLPKAELSPGYYDVMLQDKLLTSIAINNSKEESVLGNYRPDQLKEIFKEYPNITVSSSASNEEFSVALREKIEGRVLWKYALFLVLVFLFIEVLILRFL